MTKNTLTPAELMEYCTKNDIRIEVKDSIVTLVKFFQAGNQSEYISAENDVSIVYSIPVIKSDSSIWGTTSDGIGGFVGCKNGHMRINVSGVKKRFINELKTLLDQ
jgi:hypothetical protein